MAAIRRVVVVLGALLPLAACGAYAETGKAIDAEVKNVANAVKQQSGTADELADRVTGTSRGYNMSLKVLSTEDVEPVGANGLTARLTVAFHFAGFPDGFGDAPARTTCYEMKFNAAGLMDDPDDVSCPHDPWA